MRWEQQQLRRMARIRNGADHSAVVDPNGEIPVYGSGGEFTRATRALYKGPAVLLGRKGTINRPILVDGEFWTVDTMFCALPLAGTDPRFLYYACTTIPFEKLSTNTALPSMTQGDLNATRIPQPPAEDQQLIADFLDRETAKIDELIGKQEQLIATLREDRIATITHAVTKGLDPNAEMKDSGVEWLGEIPAHWNATKLGWHTSCRSGEAAVGNVEEYQDDAHCNPVIGGNGVLGYSIDSNVTGGVLAIGRVGALCGNVHLVTSPAWVTDNALLLALIDSAYGNRYLLLLLTARRLNDLASKTAQPLITGTQVSRQRLPLPPMSEQHSIVEYLDAHCAQIDALIVKSEQMIGVLREYRSALITDAVTGKIDVRGAA